MEHGFGKRFCHWFCRALVRARRGSFLCYHTGVYLVSVSCTHQSHACTNQIPAFLISKMDVDDGSADATMKSPVAVESTSFEVKTPRSQCAEKWPDSPTERRIRSRTILDEVEENLAQSMLVFLLADLRLMSATGRVLTKYETIAIASDPPTRSNASSLAGLRDSLSKNPVSESLIKKMEEGLSPAQIMAVLIIELKRTVEARRAEEERLRAERFGPYLPKRDAFKDEGFMYFEPDKKSGNYKLRAKEEDMHSLLRAYADMIGEDLKGEVPRIARRASMLYSSDRSRNSEPPLHSKYQMSSINEGENEDDDTDADNPTAATQTSGQAVSNSITRRVTQQTQTPLQRAEALRQSIMTGPLIVDQETRTNEEFGEVTDAFFRQGAETGPRSGESQRLNLSQEELLDYMEKAVESRVYGQLDFLADFFREGTVSKLMAESNARVVWMNDWYPLKVHWLFLLQHVIFCPRLQ